MINALLKRKLRGKHYVADKNNIFRVAVNEGLEQTVYINSCPILNQHGKINSRGFKRNNQTIYSGINILITQKENTLNLQNEYGIVSVLFHEIKQQSGFQSFTGEKYRAVLLSTAGVIYPATNGFVIENENEIELRFQTDRDVYFVNMSDYCMIFEISDKLSFSINAIWENMQSRAQFFTESDGRNHTLKIKAPNGERVAVSFNAYAPKSIFDTPLDKKFPRVNHVYAEQVYLSSEEQWLCLRPDCNAFRDLYKKEVLSAKVYFRNINKAKGNLFFGLLRFLWCTFAIAWEAREEPEQWSDRAREVGNYYELDITDYIKHVFQNESAVTPGLVLKSNSENLLLLPTGDNYMFPILLEIRLRH